MPRRSRYAYFRVRRGFSTAGYTLELSSDSARMAVIRLWDKGKEVSGAFESEAQLKEMMGRYYRFVPELRAKGWLDDKDIHDWDEDQNNIDPTAADRQRRKRAKIGPDNRNGHAHVTPFVTPVSRPPTETETDTETLTPPAGSPTVSRPPAPSWATLDPPTKARARDVADAAAEFLGRSLRTSEVDLVRQWACLTRDGAPVPVNRILAVMRSEMGRETPEGKPPANLRWCEDAVLALGRGDQSLPGLQARVDALQATAP